MPTTWTDISDIVTIYTDSVNDNSKDYDTDEDYDNDVVYDGVKTTDYDNVTDEITIYTKVSDI